MEGRDWRVRERKGKGREREGIGCLSRKRFTPYEMLGEESKSRVQVLDAGDELFVFYEIECFFPKS